MRDVFKHKSPNFDKLLKYGFTKTDDAYSFVIDILNGQFELRVKICQSNSEVKTEVTDVGTQELYTLHLVEAASGAFVGAIRCEYERVLEEIAEKCFEQDVFKSDCAHKVIDYVRNKYGDELEFLWENSPTSAIWRRKDNRKWYAVILEVSKRKLGLNSDETVAVIDLRIDPKILPDIVDGKKFFAGYHMNKKHWFTICLDESVPTNEICNWIDKSYDIAKKG